MTESCLNPACRGPLLSEREVAQGMHIPNCLPPPTHLKERAQILRFIPRSLKERFLVHTKSATSVLMTGGDCA